MSEMFKIKKKPKKTCLDQISIVLKKCDIQGIIIKVLLYITNNNTNKTDSRYYIKFPLSK